jgi:hypothetical protein
MVGWRFNNLRSILESDTPDNFRQLISLQPPPILRGGGDQNALEFLLLATVYKTRGDVAAANAAQAPAERAARIETPCGHAAPGHVVRFCAVGQQISRLISAQDGSVVSWPARLRRQRARK